MAADGVLTIDEVTAPLRTVEKAARVLARWGQLTRVRVGGHCPIWRSHIEARTKEQDGWAPGRGDE